MKNITRYLTAIKTKEVKAMGIFNNNSYNRPGPGVSKNPRKKTALFRFFDIFFGKFWDLLKLNALYVLMCIPIVTIGAATAGFTYCIKNIVAGKPIFVFHDFFKGFKNNWKQGTAMLLINVIVGFVFFVAFSFYVFSPEIVTSSAMRLVFAIILGVITIIYTMMQFYTYLFMVTFDMRFSVVLKNSLLFIVIGIKENFIAVFFTMVYVFLVILAFFPFSLILCMIILMSLIATTNIFIVYPVVKRIMIDPYLEEKNTEEEQVFKDEIE